MNKSHVSVIPQQKQLGSDNDDEQTLQEKIDLLDEHKKKCVSQGKYVEAKLTDDTLNKTKEHLKLVRQRMLDKKHQDERNAITSQLQEEFNAIVKKWEEKESEYDEAVKKESDKINERQIQRRNEIIENYKNLIPTVHPSNETLRLKKIEEGLAKQGKYEDAHKVQLQVQISIEKDKEYANMLARKAVEAEIKGLEDKQKQLEESFSIKVLEMKNTMDKQRNEEIDTFRKKHKITTNDIVYRQSSEKRQLEKNTSAGMALSQALASKYTITGKSLVK